MSIAIKGGIRVAADRRWKADILIPGAVADIVVWDPKLPKTIRVANQLSIIVYNVFEGFEVAAQAHHTLSRGKVVCSYGRNEPFAWSVASMCPARPSHRKTAHFSTRKDLFSARFIHRDPQNIPSGV